MNPILANPFHALGLIANSSEREIQKQFATFSAYARVGKSIKSDCDFPLLPPVIRTEETIRTAASQIEQPVNRLHHALFWFLSSNHIDVTALGYLRSNNSAKAAEIWNLAVLDRPITSKNFSAAHNLSTLQLLFASLNGSINAAIFESAIRLKGKAVTNCFDEFAKLVVGEKVSVDLKEILKLFANDLLNYSTVHDGKAASLLSAFSEFPVETRSYVSGKLVDGPASRLRGLIEAAIRDRNDSPEDANVIGFELHKNCVDDFRVLRDVLGVEHPQFQMIANDLANEILQCSIDYFNEFIESDTIDPGKDALRLLKLARSIGPTGAVRHRLEENGPTIESWNSTTEERSKAKAVKNDIEIVGRKLKAFGTGKVSAKRAATFIEGCQPTLANLARNLSDDKELYLKLCDAVASNALGMTVSSVNEIQEDANLQSSNYLKSLGAVTKLKQEVADGFQVMSLLAKMDMSATMRGRCEENGRVLNRMIRELNVIVEQPVRTRAAGAASALEDRPLFTAPLSNATGGFGLLWSWLVDNPKNFYGVFAVIGVIVACGLMSQAPRSGQNPKNTNGNSSTATNVNIAQNASSAAVIQTSPTPTPKTERPASGTLMSRGVGGRGLGSLTISNGTSKDAIAKLVNLTTGKSHREVYVRANSSTTVSGIAPGEYELFFSKGLDYAPSLRKFLRDAEYSKFDDTFLYQETRDSYGINYRTYRVTLDKVAFGTARTSAVDESSFDNK